VSAVAPARDMLPPLVSMAAREEEDMLRELVDVEEGGEMMNQRTDVPSVAAVMAVISPRPPGGEITTRVLGVVGDVEEEGVDWRMVVDGICRLCCWWRWWLIFHWVVVLVVD